MIIEEHDFYGKIFESQVRVKDLYLTNLIKVEDEILYIHGMRQVDDNNIEFEVIDLETKKGAFFIFSKNTIITVIHSEAVDCFNQRFDKDVFALSTFELLPEIG